MNLEIDGGKDDPLAVIGGIVGASRGIESSLREWVRIARSRGHSWQEVAEALGVTRQSAWERFKDAEEHPDAVIRNVLGSLRRPEGAPTLEQIREEERRKEAEVEERKYGKEKR